MLPVSAMPMVHEPVHQRAGQQEQIRQYPQQMRAVLGEEQHTGYRKKTV
jgi:hypothetical protein